MNVAKYTNGEPYAFELGGLLKGSTAFLVGGSPSIMKQDLSVFSKPGAVVVGMNNVGKVIKTDMDVFADSPLCYYPSVLSNPASMKFSKIVYADDLSLPGTPWKTLPNTYFYDFSEEKEKENAISSRNNCLAISIELLAAMNVERIVLCGCDFDAGGYSDGRAPLSKRHIEWNRHLYYEQTQWLSDMVMSLVMRDISFADASVYSKLPFDKFMQGAEDVMVKTTLEDEAERLDEKRAKEDRARKIVHCIDLYDYDKIEERFNRIRARNGDFKPYHTPVVSCLALGQELDELGQSLEYDCLHLLCLCYLHSLAESNPGRKVYMFVDNVTDKQIDMMRKVGKGLDLHFVTLKKETKKLIPPQGARGWGCNLRCALPKILNEYNCFWLDCDTIVKGDLDELEDEAEKAYEKSGEHHFFQGVQDFGYYAWHNMKKHLYINAGVVFMRLSAIRAAHKEDDLLKVCRYWSSSTAYDNQSSDQNTINAFGCDRVPDEWNVQEWTVDQGLGERPDEIKYSGKIYHYIWVKHNLMYRRNNMTSLLFEEMKEVYLTLGDDIFDFKGGIQWKNEMLTR